MNYFGSQASSKDDDFVRLSDSPSLYAEGGGDSENEKGDKGHLHYEKPEDDEEDHEHGHDHSHEHADVKLERDHAKSLVYKGKDADKLQIYGEQAHALRRMDSMIAVKYGVGEDSDEKDSDVSDLSAIDGVGKELEAWPFLTNQYRVGTEIKLDPQELEKTEAIKYIIDQLDEQAGKLPTPNKEDPDSMKLDTAHFQTHLQGWKVMPKRLSIKHIDPEDEKEKEYTYGTQEENLALMKLFQEDPKREEILDWHFKDYLQGIYRVKTQYENSEGTGINIPLQSQIKQDDPEVVYSDEENQIAEPEPNQDAKKIKEKTIEYSDMETIRLVEEKDGKKEQILFFVISGVESATNRQCIVIHKFLKTQHDEQLKKKEHDEKFHHVEIDANGNPIPFVPDVQTLTQIAKIYLSDNNKQQEVLCYPTHARTWIQYANCIFYWDVSHDDSKVSYQLKKYNLLEEQEEDVQTKKFQQEIKEQMKNDEGEEKEVVRIGLCGIFRYRSMEREIINWNEHKSILHESEDHFLNRLLVAFAYQSDDHSSQKLNIEIRHTKNLSNVIVDKRFDNKLNGQLFFFHLPISYQNQWLKENESGMKELKGSKIVVSFDHIVDIFNVDDEGTGKDNDEVPIGKSKKEFEVNSDPQDQAFLIRLSLCLLNRSLQRYLLFENRVGFQISNEKWEGDKEEFLEKNFNEFPKEEEIDETNDRIIEKLDKIYEPKAHDDRQQYLVRELYQSLINQEKYCSKEGDFERDTTAQNINLVYDKHKDESIYGIHTQQNRFFILLATDKNYVRRTFLNSECAKTENPFMQLIDNTQVSMKQVHPKFNNLFIDHYIENVGESKDKANWTRKIAYIHKEEKDGKATKKVCFVKVDASQGDQLKQFGQLWGQIWPKDKGYDYYKFNVSGKNEFYKQRIMEFADDDRKIKPRINFQSEDLIKDMEDSDDEEEQLMSAGLYIELYDLENKCVVEGSQDQLQDFYGKTEILKRERETMFRLQGLTQSSNVYRGRKKDSYVQNYQWCFMHPCKKWAKILEYRAVWSDKKPELNKLELFGLKIVVFAKEYPEQINHFYPLFNKKNDIIGTQWHSDDFRMRMRRFKESEYQFHSDITSSGYKKYFNEDNLDEMTMLLFEAKLSKKIQANHELFDKTERLNLLEESVRTIMNMVPHDMDMFRRRLNNTKNVHFDFFQPLENLRGQCLANFFIRDPDMLTREIDALEEFGDSMEKSLVEELADETTLSTLKSLNWLRQRGEPCFDLHFNNLLNHGFADDNIVTSLKIIIEHILSIDTSNSLQRMVASIVPTLIASENDDFECFKDYFVAIDPETQGTKLESKLTCFMQNLKDQCLPGFADTECFFDRYSSNLVMQTDLRRSTTKRIIDRDEENDEKKDIKVDHFALNIKPFILKKKIDEFNEMVGDEIDGSKKTVGGHPFDDLDLARQLEQIVNKYDYEIDNYLSIKFMIDSQFEITSKFVKTQAFVYLTFFFIPMLAQIFFFGEDQLCLWYDEKNICQYALSGPNWVLYCIHSCLIVSILFLGIEFVQLDENGTWDYISDTQNQIDLITLFTFFYYYTLRFYDQKNPLVAIDGDMKPENPDEVSRIFWYSVLQTVIISASFMKLMGFLKVNPDFGLLVDCVSKCLEDCVPFTTFLTAWMGIFCILYRILGMGIGEGDYGADPSLDINLFAQYSIQTYRNTVGDDAPPIYPYWDAQTKTPYKSDFMRFMVWTVWMANSLLLMMILLNFLIAILCYSFEDVNNAASQYEYKAKAAMNVDTMLLQKVMGNLVPFEAVSLTCDCSVPRSANPIDKAVEQIKSNQEEIKEKLIKGVQKETQKQIDTVERKLKMETNAIKQIVKREIQNEKEEIGLQIDECIKQLGEMQKDLKSEVSKNKQSLIERNSSFKENVSSKVGDVQSRMSEQMSSVSQGILRRMTNVRDKMKQGLGGVDKNVGDSQKNSETIQDEVRDALENVVKNQVNLLLEQIKILNENAAKQQEKNHEEMEILKESLKEQLNEIKKDNQEELAKIKAELIETMDSKTAAAKTKNDDQAKVLKTEIEDVLEKMNKQLESQTDDQIDKLKQQIDSKYGEVQKIVDEIKAKQDEGDEE